MRRASVALVFAFALVLTMAFPAIAADLHEPHQGTTCAEGEIGTFHFVLNQHDGVPQTLTVEWTGGDTTYNTPDKVNGGTQHWTVEGPGFDSAYTSGDGKLVLSDYECSDGKKDDGK